MSSSSLAIIFSSEDTCLLCQISKTNPLAHFLFEALYFFAVSICQLAASLSYMELLSLIVTNTYILLKMSINHSYLVSLEQNSALIYMNKGMHQGISNFIKSYHVAMVHII